MFGKHPYNKAVNYFMKLRWSTPGTLMYKENLYNVIWFSKEALRKNERDGDAHVLLANAYYLASLMDRTSSDNYVRYFPFAVAVIYEWKSKPMYTKAKENGEKVYCGILEEMKRYNSEHPEIPEGSLLAKLHQLYYQQALV